MEWSEFELHSARRQLIKTTGHLLDARKALIATLQHNSGYASMNKTTLSVESNISALIEGVNETIKFCGHAADDLKRQMKEPDATPPPIRGRMGVQLTPMQRQLALDGVKFQTMPDFVATKADKKVHKILNVKFNPPKQRKREKITKTNPAIC